MTPPTTTPVALPSTGNVSIDAAIAAALAIGTPFIEGAAATNPYAAAGLALANVGISMYSELMAKSIKGVTTLADLEEAVTGVSAVLSTFRAHVEAGEAAEAAAKKT